MKAQRTPLRGQTSGHFRIFIHVQVVIIVDKPIVQGLAKAAQIMTARKTQTPRTFQQSFKPAARLSDSGGRVPAVPRILPAGEAGALEGAPGAFFFDFRFMESNP